MKCPIRLPGGDGINTSGVNCSILTALLHTNLTGDVIIS